MSELRRDVRFAVRTLTKSPVSALAAVATLALGIGATTAVFSTVNATLLRPLPYPNPQDLRSLGTTFPDGGMTNGLVSPPEMLRLRDPSLSVMAAAGAVRLEATLVRDDGTPVPLLAHGVTDGFFELFGLTMARGVGFTPEHHVPAPGSPNGVVLSHRLWREMYGADPAIVGRTIRLAEAPLPWTVLGVAHRDFDMPRGAEVWLNQRVAPQSPVHNLEAYLRVRPGTSSERLRNELDTVMAGLAQDFPSVNTGRAYVVRPLVESIVGDLGPILVVVLCATALLLMLACVNVTTLLLARGAARAREIALRVALGATRGHVIRQLLVESVVLATAGAVAGLLLAYLGIRALMLIGAEQLPRLDTVPFDARVLLFALAVLVASGLLVGFAPALRLARTRINVLVNDSGRTAARGRGTYRLLGAMTVAEIALAITLVAGAGWLVRSFENLQSSDPGFQSTGRIVFDLSLPNSRYKQPAQTTRELFAQLRGIAGVTAVGGASSLPLRPDRDGTPFVQVQGQPFDPNRPPIARQRTVTPEFFTAMGIRMVAGRQFTEQDGPAAALVTIVNETFVRRYLGGQDPLTTLIASGYPTIAAGAPRRAIVGVVEDVKYASLSGEPEPAFYVSGAPFRQAVVVATSLGDPAAVISAVRGELQTFDPQLAIAIEPYASIVASTLSRQQLGMTLMIVFGAMTLALAAVGIYGVIAYASSQRSCEVATRMALGATRWDIFRLMVGRGFTLAAAGAMLGLAGAYASGRMASGWLYEVSASDPAILATGLVLVVAIAMVATVVSARRASRVDPALSLQSE